MSVFDFPVLDGICPSWADINVRISPGVGAPLIEIGDISAISSGWTVEVGEQREGGRVIKRTRGSVSNEASMTLYASGYQKLITALMLAAPFNLKAQKLISLVHFTVHVTWTPPGSIQLLEYKLKGCRILGRTFDSSEGNDAQQIEVPLSPLEIVDVVNGVEVVPV
jgi:hypothetical protein